MGAKTPAARPVQPSGEQGAPPRGGSPCVFIFSPKRLSLLSTSGPCESTVGKDAGASHWKLGTRAEHPQIQVGEEKSVRQSEQPVWGTHKLAGEARQPRRASSAVSLGLIWEGGPSPKGTVGLLGLVPAE